MKSIITLIILIFSSQILFARRSLLSFEPDNNYTYIQDEILYKKLFEDLGYVLYAEFYNPKMKEVRLLEKHYNKIEGQEYLSRETIYEYDKGGWLIKKTTLSISGPDSTPDSTKNSVGYVYSSERNIITVTKEQQHKPPQIVHYEFSSGEKPLLRKIVKSLPFGKSDTTIFRYHHADQHIEQVIVNGEKLDVRYSLRDNADSSDRDELKYGMPVLAKLERFDEILAQKGKIIQISLEKKNGEAERIQVLLTKNAIAYSLLKGVPPPKHNYRVNGLYEFDQSLKVNYIFGWDNKYVHYPDNAIHYDPDDHLSYYVFEDTLSRDPFEEIVGNIYEMTKTKKGWVTKMTSLRIFHDGNIICKKNTTTLNDGFQRLIIENIKSEQ